MVHLCRCAPRHACIQLCTGSDEILSNCRFVARRRRRQLTRTVCAQVHRCRCTSSTMWVSSLYIVYVCVPVQETTSTQANIVANFDIILCHQYDRPLAQRPERLPSHTLPTPHSRGRRWDKPSRITHWAPGSGGLLFDTACLVGYEP